MSFWHVLEWLQESVLDERNNNVQLVSIAQKRSLGFLVKRKRF